MTENDQILNIHRQDNIRKELDAKIEKKVSYQFFISVLAAVSIVGTSIFSYAFLQISELNNKLEELNKNVIVIETKIDERK